ncbi:MAG: hypothetical protein ACTSPB_24850 [Candidatus Thorarchaeota archaeon]
MKINEIISESKPHVPVIVAHDPKEAEKKFLDANKGKAGEGHDVRAALKIVRDRYDVEIVGDIEDCHGKHSEKCGDGKDSMLTKDNR